jgi:hypothetical protein
VDVPDKTVDHRTGVAVHNTCDRTSECWARAASLLGETRARA